MNRPSSGATLKTRFWNKVKKTSGCWIWIGNKRADGYGYICIFYRRCRTHRVSWELKHGPIPDGKKVLHRCDNPACVRPSHLFLGDQTDNMHDMWKKGRGIVNSVSGEKWRDSHLASLPRGERHRNSKLKRDQIKTIRALAKSGVPQRTIATRFKVSQAWISLIVKRRWWSHV
jgi:hypothetical protein